MPVPCIRLLPLRRLAENRLAATPVVAPVAPAWGLRHHSHTLVLVVACAIGVYLCYRLALPFLSSLVWSLTLAVVVMPCHRWLEARLKSRSAAALISVLAVGLLVVTPALFVGQQLVMQAANGATLVKAKIESGEWRRAIDSRPRLARLADHIEQRVDLPGAAQKLAAWLTAGAAAIVKGSVVQVVAFALTLYLLFYLLRDRHAALRALGALLPLADAEIVRLRERVSDTICATVYGTLAVSAVQGLLGGLMFWCLGLPAALLWGVVMAVLAVVPVLGAFVVWVPAALYLALDGSWGKALILAVWGTVIVGSSDNLLRPVLVGGRLKLHTVLVFIGVVGGVLLFGAAGLVLGPVLLTITMVLLEIWRERTATEGALIPDGEGPGSGSAAGAPEQPAAAETRPPAG
jgi:predicted PurR-regulated permease PerM